MLCESFNEVLNDIDFSKRFKSLWVTNKLNGSEDYLVSSKLMDMVGDDLKEFRKNLMSKPSPKKIKELQSLIIPPKGVRRKNLSVGEMPEDEGSELLDGDIEEQMDVNEEIDNNESDVNNNIMPDVNSRDSGKDSDEEEITGLEQYCSNVSQDLKKDCIFVDNLEKLLNESDTSKIFTGQMIQLRQAMSRAKRSLKKRLYVEKND
jgi:hypothetical protein